jgi:hypothetical protein
LGFSGCDFSAIASGFAFATGADSGFTGSGSTAGSGLSRSATSRSIITANTSTSWQGTSGTQISLNGSTLEVQQSQPRIAKQSSCDKGQVILRLDSSTISHLIQSLNADQSEISTDITASIQQGKVHICVD